ncbi:hypothetical protein ACFQY5_10800 [Paeniroseomonas aquatica]|uniref:hypothetical protein n=1 Tax=Paeniroseomonas aquatica TaxID=373043 RepID=UPI00360CABCF
MIRHHPKGQEDIEKTATGLGQASGYEAGMRRQIPCVEPQRDGRDLMPYGQVGGLTFEIRHVAPGQEKRCSMRRSLPRESAGDGR